MQSQVQVQGQDEQESLSPRMRGLITGYHAAAAPRADEAGLSEEMRAVIDRYVHAFGTRTDL